MSIELLQKSIDVFTAELDKTPDSDFGKATKCDGWDVTGLMKHIVGGCVAANMALRGATREENSSFFTNYQFGPDIRAEYAAATADHVRAFREFGDLGGVVQHPMMDMPADRMLMFRIGDFVLHAWDLAAGMGRTIVLPADLVQYVWDSLSPMAAGIGSIGVFGSGPSGSVPDDADLQTRLLDLSGRRP